MNPLYDLFENWYEWASAKAVWIFCCVCMAAVVVLAIILPRHYFPVVAGLGGFLCFSIWVLALLKLREEREDRDVIVARKRDRAAHPRQIG